MKSIRYTVVPGKMGGKEEPRIALTVYKEWKSGGLIVQAANEEEVSKSLSSE